MTTTFVTSKMHSIVEWKYKPTFFTYHKVRYWAVSIDASAKLLYRREESTSRITTIISNVTRIYNVTRITAPWFIWAAYGPQAIFSTTTTTTKPHRKHRSYHSFNTGQSRAAQGELHQSTAQIQPRCSDKHIAVWCSTEPPLHHANILGHSAGVKYPRLSPEIYRQPLIRVEDSCLVKHYMEVTGQSHNGL